MSFSGSSAARSKSWAQIRLAEGSSTWVPRNTMRSRSSRWYRSAPRSPGDIWATVSIPEAYCPPWALLPAVGTAAPPAVQPGGLRAETDDMVRTPFRPMAGIAAVVLAGGGLAGGGLAGGAVPAHAAPRSAPLSYTTVWTHKI